MEQRISLITLGVSDLNRSKAFYERLRWKGRTSAMYLPARRSSPPFPVFGRPVHRSGSLPLITTRWFSTSLSDPASRRARLPLQSIVDGGSRSAYPCPGFRRRASRASPYLPSTLAGEALPPPSDIGPGPRTSPGYGIRWRLSRFGHPQATANTKP